MAKSLTERDERVIWHPYTQHQDKQPPIPITHGKGSLLFDEQGKTYIDAISSWWVNLHGHAHPDIAEKVYAQAKRLEQVIFTGFTHEPAIELAERLLPLLPGDLTRIFYSDNGSTAVEVALKMAIQYWKNQEDHAELAPSGNVLPRESPSGSPLPEATPDPDASRRRKILAFAHAYHGDTFGAMSVSGRSLFTAAFQDHLFETLTVDTPTTANIGELCAIIRSQGGEIACFIYEPLLQAAGGMRLYEPALLDQLLDTARECGILCIADEVLTGFGRTGKLFAGEYLRNTADIICLSKGLTGGTMALGATASTERIFRAFLSEDKTKTFFHGHSFTANPLACASALASLDLLLQPDCLRRIDTIAARHLAFAGKLSHNAAVRNLRTLGTVLAFEINTGKDEYTNRIGARITEQALSNGIYLRPLGNTVYLMPPYCITEEELDQVYRFLLGLIGEN